jgi:hypothetical protein
MPPQKEEGDEEEEEEALELPPRPKDAVSPALAILEEAKAEEAKEEEEQPTDIFTSFMNFLTGKK